eukprot:3048851-Prymnesium_polylepis.1
MYKWAQGAKERNSAECVAGIRGCRRLQDGSAVRMRQPAESRAWCAMSASGAPMAALVRHNGAGQGWVSVPFRNVPFRSVLVGPAPP